MAKTNPVRIEDLLENEGWLRALARSLVGSSDEVDEILQDLWRSAMASPPRHGSHPRAWLRTSLRNVVAARGRRRRWSGRLEEPSQAVIAPGAGPGAAVEGREVEAVVSRAVLDLPDPFRATVIACYFEGKTPGDLAVERGVPAATVRSWLHRGLAMLRERLESRYGRGAASLRAALLPLLILVPRRGAERLPFLMLATAGVVVCATAGWIVFGLSADPVLETFELEQAADVAPARTERRRISSPVRPAEAVAEIEGHALRMRVDVVRDDTLVDTTVEATVSLGLRGHDGDALAADMLWSTEAEELARCELIAGEEFILEVEEPGGYLLACRPDGARNQARLRVRSGRATRVTTEILDDVVIEVSGDRAHLADVFLVADLAHPDRVLPARRVDRTRWIVDGPLAAPVRVALRAGDEEWRTDVTLRETELRLPDTGRSSVAVVDEAGAPVPSFSARLVRGDGLVAELVADPDGVLELPLDGDERNARLLVSATGHVRAAISEVAAVLSAGEPVRLPRASFLGAFVLVDGDEPESSTAYLGVGSRPILRTDVDSRGRLVLTDLLYSTKGSHAALERLFGHENGWSLWCCGRDAEGRVVRADEVPGFALRNGRVALSTSTARVEVTVTSVETGDPIAGADVDLVPAPGGVPVPALAGLVEPLITDALGLAGWRDAAAGEWSVRAWVGGYEATEVSLEVDPLRQTTRAAVALPVAVRCCEEVFTFEDR